MRQETGRNSKNSETKASIRLASGGRFFSASILDEIADKSVIEVIIDTPRVTLVPATMVNALPLESLLAINGQAPLSNEVVVKSNNIDGRVAVIAIAKSAFDAISTSAEHVYFTTPLLNNSHYREKALVIEVVDGCCYFRLYNNGLIFAEALEITTAEDILFYTSQILDKTSMEQNIPIYIIGSTNSAKIVKKYYKKVICE